MRKIYYYGVIFFLCIIIIYIAMKYTRKFKNTNNRTRRVNMGKNMIYKKNIFSAQTFRHVLSACKNIRDDKMVLDPKATGRLMYEFKSTDPLVSTIFNKPFIQKIRQITGNYNLVPCYEVPIEYRKYKKGSHMDWHRDSQMLDDQLQYECVVTLTNTSDSKSLFKKDERVQSVSSEPNSIIIVQARGIPHKVTKTNSGERTILKLVFKENDKR